MRSILSFGDAVMPSYSFKCFKCNNALTEIRPMSECKNKVRCPNCDEDMERDYVAEHSSTYHCSGNWPMVSDSMAVHPDQRAEAAADSIKKGVPTDYDSQGRPVLTSARHRKRYAEAYGFYAKSAGYSDPTRR